MSSSVVTTGPVFDHLRHLSDSRGLFEHALYTEPRQEHGYCLDDVARGLVVTCREPDTMGELDDLIERYLDFTLLALEPDGSCHNRMNVAGEWVDEPALGDWWGRAVWGLGVAAVQAPTATMRASALLGFRIASQSRSPHLHAMVFAALGAGEVLAAQSTESSAEHLLRDACQAIGPETGDPRWPWPEERLRYGSGSVAEAVLVCGSSLEEPATVDHGLSLLDFLLDIETTEGRLSVTPVGGRGLDDDLGNDLAGTDLDVTDQQPIEVAALADACARAYGLTGDLRWREGVRMAWAWFCGDNDSGTPMCDPSTGAGFDGLKMVGRNENQGAESTLAALSTAQHAIRLGLLE